MLVWFGMFMIILLLGAVKTSYPYNRKIFLVLVAIVIVFVVGSRDATLQHGSDLNNYYRLYGRAIELGWKELLETTEMEKGFLLVNFILAKIVPWNQFIIYAQAAFCIGSSLWFINKNTKNVYAATIFFISFGNFQFFLTGFRQSIAMAICLFAYEAAKNKKLLKFIVFVLLATSMHKSAIVFLVMYLVLNAKDKPRNTVVLICGVFALSFFIPQILDLGNSFLDKEYTEGYVGNVFGGLVPIAICLLTILLTVLVKKDKTKSNKKELLPLLRTTIINGGVYSMRYSALVLERISFYFNPAVPVLLAENLRSVDGVKQRTLLQFLAIVLSAVLFLWRVSSQMGEYQFFWG